MDFYSKLKLAENKFTKIERKIADYILEHPDNVLYKTITDLAAEIGVSETSVFRFCKTLDFDGYQQFKLSLAQYLSIDNNINDIEMNKKVSREDSVDDIISKLLAANMESLKLTVSVLQKENIESAVDLFIKSESIAFFGMGSSNITAKDAKRKFSRIRKNLLYTPDLHDQMIVASTMSEKDVAVVFSYSGATKDTIDILKVLESQNVPIILITRYAVSTATEYSDIVLLCGSNGVFTGDSFSNKISQLFVMDILYTVYYMKTYDVSKAYKLKSYNAINPRIY